MAVIVATVSETIRSNHCETYTGWISNVIVIVLLKLPGGSTLHWCAGQGLV